MRNEFGWLNNNLPSNSHEGKERGGGIIENVAKIMFFMKVDNRRAYYLIIWALKVGVYVGVGVVYLSKVFENKRK